jgi:hypothetical protein
MVADAVEHLAAHMAGQPTVAVPADADLTWWAHEVRQAIWICDHERLTAVMVNGAIAGIGEDTITLMYVTAMADAPDAVRRFWAEPCDRD